MDECPTEFSENALNVLFDYFEESEDDTGSQIEFDPYHISQCYKENTIEDVTSIANQAILSKALRALDDPEDEDDREEVTKQVIQAFLQQKGAFIGFTDRGTVVYRSY